MGRPSLSSGVDSICSTPNTTFIVIAARVLYWSMLLTMLLSFADARVYEASWRVYTGSQTSRAGGEAFHGESGLAPDLVGRQRLLPQAHERLSHRNLLQITGMCSHFWYALFSFPPFMMCCNQPMCQSLSACVQLSASSS